MIERDALLHELKRRLIERTEDVTRELVGGGPDHAREHWIGQRTAKGGPGDSYQIELRGEKRGQCFHFATMTGGDLLWLIQDRKGIHFQGAIRWGCQFVSIPCWLDEPSQPAPELRPPQQPIEAQAEGAATDATLERVFDIWCNADPVDGAKGAIADTPAEIYLRSRGIDPDKLYRGYGVYPGWPQTLRYSQDAVRLPNVRARPALIIAVNDARTGLVRGLQRIFLHTDGRPVLRADGKKDKKTLGQIGGNAARLTCGIHPEGCWGIAEGVESALAARQLFGIPVWAAISAGNMPQVAPPSWARRIKIIADNDDVGLANAAAARDVYRQIRSVESVEVMTACRAGADAADVLQERAHGR